MQGEREREENKPSLDAVRQADFFSSELFAEKIVLHDQLYDEIPPQY